MGELFTIGFTGKSAEAFFTLLEQSRVTRVIDTRLNNTSQLAGFSKAHDLAFFLRRICTIAYEHRLDFAPTAKLLESYKTGQVSWEVYEQAYLQLLDERGIRQQIAAEDFDGACLLCSEHVPKRCHRRLLAEYIQASNPTLSITHLQ